MKNYDIMSHFKNLIQQKKIRSASFCIAKNGKIILCDAMGEMNLGNGMRKNIDNAQISGPNALIDYCAGCATHHSAFDQTMHIGEKTMYHEGTGPCMLMVNRKKKIAAVWNTPFWTEYEWHTEPIKSTTDIIWRNYL